MGIYDKNIEAFNRFQPQFPIGQGRNEFGAEPVILENGQRDIRCNGKKGEVYIHGGVDVLAEAASRTEGVYIEGNSVIVSFGFGLGYEAREIIKKMGAGTNFVIAEPDAGFIELAAECADISDIIETPNVHFMSLIDMHEVTKLFQTLISAQNYKNVAVFVVSTYVDIYFDKCRELLFLLDDIRASYELNEATVTRFTTEWQKNALLNASYNIDSILVSEIYGKFNGLPCIIVSAGPSLTKNIFLLKGNEDKFLIISVDTALKPLLEHGVKPHFVVSLDGQQKVFKKFRDLEYSDIPLIYVPTSSAPVVENHGGINILSVVQDEFYKRLLISAGKTPEAFEMGGSVVTGSVAFAERAGCDPIVHIGLDLAYTGMMSHAPGTAFEKRVDLSNISEPLSVPAYDGGFVYSNRVFQQYLSWFKTYALSDKSGREYIDATEGGAKIGGYNNMTLWDVMCKYATTGVKSAVREVLDNAAVLSEADKKHIRAKYKEAIRFALKIKRPAKEASMRLMLIHHKLTSKEFNPNVVKALYSKVAPFEEKVKNGGDKLEMLGIALSPFVERLNREFEAAKFESDLERNKFAALSYAKYYGEISDSIARLEQVLNEVDRRL